MWIRLKGKHLRAGGGAAVTVALIGNPNAGKTAIFNRLTGLAHKVGNYPGVTVERKEGLCTLEGVPVRFLDLPGTYSLAANSPEEKVAVDVLLGTLKGEVRPQIVLQVVDASNLERNLYLLSQVLETGLPVVLALNMMDVAEARGIRIDTGLLSTRLDAPVVPVEGHRGKGMEDLKGALSAVVKRCVEKRPPSLQGPRLPLDPVKDVVEAVRQELSPAVERARAVELRSVEVLRALIDRGGHAESRLVGLLGESCRERLEAVRPRLTTSMPLAVFEASSRYAWVRERLEGCVTRQRPEGRAWSEQLDRILTHRVLGLVIFGILMLLVFQSIFVGARPLMDAVELGFGELRAVVRTLLPEGALRSLLADGVIAGVGMVVMFLPQILILFLFIGLLEDCGYMARVAFLMDKIMSKCGLSGKSFIPMLSGFACAVPGILAARVIEDRRDRLATMLVTPLMSCSARLPVYSVFIGTFVPERPVISGVLGLQALTLFLLYALGVVMAVAVAWVLRRTLLRGPRPHFVLELPSYKWPSAYGLAIRLKDRGQEFLLRAGTAILAIAVVVWALAYFPHSAAIARRFDAERARVRSEVPEGAARDAALAGIGNDEAATFLEDSYFARMGMAVEPVFEPLGWDWRISMAAIASFPAREVLVSTLGTIFHLGVELDMHSPALRESLRAARRAPAPGGPPDGMQLFTVPVAVSVLVFFALSCQCGATVVTLWRETGSRLWAAFGFGYMTALAYIAALVAYQVGIRF